MSLLTRLFQHIEPRDFATLLPHNIVLRALRMASGQRGIRDDPALDERDPELVAAVLDVVRWLGEHWFRHEALGVDHVPGVGPALLVGNHSGGLMVFDALLAMVRIADRFGPGRPVYTLGHDIIQWDPTLDKYTRRFGGLPAGHEMAEAALGRGHLVLVYPGSDFDAFRPFTERNQVVLARRTGFVRLALRTRVPIVPVVTAGAHEQFVVLTRGEGLAKLLGLKRLLRTNVFPIALSIPWGLTSGYVPFLPLPTQITTEFLPPMAWPDLGPEAADDEATVWHCYLQVEAAMQAHLDELTRARVPIVG